MVRRRFRLLETVVATALLITHPADASRPKPSEPTCSAASEGDTVIRSASLRLTPRSPFIIEETVRASATTNAFNRHTVVRRRATLVHELEIDVSVSGTLVITRRFGRGFRGVKEIRVTADGAGSSQIVVDGSVATLEHDTSGKVVGVLVGDHHPRLRTKAKTAAMLKHAAKLLQATTCDPSRKSPSQLGPRISFDFAGDDCQDCVDNCGVDVFVWGFLTFGTEQAFTEAADTANSSSACLRECQHAVGGPCCPNHCGEQCCEGHTAGQPPFICVGAKPGFAGSCCVPDGACGEGCCNPRSRKCVDPHQETSTCPLAVCRNPAASLCCSGPGETCFLIDDEHPDVRGPEYCCPEGTVCDTSGLLGCVSCPAGSKYCGAANADGSHKCCAPGQVCAQGGEDGCCNPEDVCGEGCCPGGPCVNGVCCQNTSCVFCGGKLLGLGETCCNNTPCAGECLGGSICCPRSHLCGPVCCPTGFFCSNDSIGTCTGCGGTKDGCALSPGNPACCEQGEHCCGDGTCCAPALRCCANRVSGVLGCNPSDLCQVIN